MPSNIIIYNLEFIILKKIKLKAQFELNNKGDFYGVRVYFMALRFFTDKG